MYELDWAEEYPAASITLFLDVSVRVLQKGFVSVAWVKKLYPLHCGEASSNPLRAQIEQNGELRADFLSLVTSWDMHLLPLNMGAPGSQVVRLWDLHQQSPWFSGIRTQFELYHRLSILQRADNGTSKPPCEPYNTYNLPLVLFSGESLLLQKTVG